MRWTKLSCVLSLAVAALVAACGDNSKQCGEGTQDIDGVCRGMGEGNNCGPGTVDVDGTCVPEEEACADGETAVEGNCVQIDLQEGAEPNGDESGANPAGVLALPAGADRFTANGCINNHASPGDSADFDRWTLTVTEPTLIKLTVDGRNGMVGGFRAAHDDASDLDLEGYLRLGLSVSSDMSRRQVYLPKAGTYNIDVADSRSVMPLTTGGVPIPAGNTDGTTSCYLLHLESQTVPAATPLVAGTAATGTIGEDLAFFTGALGDGLNSVTGTISPRSSTSLVVMNNNQLRQISGSAGSTLFGGIKAGDMPLLVLDYVYNYALEPANYEVAIDFEIDSVPLNRDGTPTVAVPSKGQFVYNGAYVFENVNLFHWEVTAENTTDGFDLNFSIPMAGVIIDQNTFFIAPFAADNTAALTGSPTASVTTTFTNYVGLLRNDTPGTYYFFVYAPRSPVGTDIVATSTITTLPETPIMLGTETADQTPNTFNSNPFSYNAGTTEPWQLLNATGTNTGALDVSFYARDASGRFDPVSVQKGAGNGPGTPGTAASNVLPVIGATFPASGASPVGHIFKNPAAATPNPTDFFVRVSPTIKTGANRSFKLDFGPQTYHKFGMLASGSTTTVTDEPLTAAIPERRFYYDAPAGSKVTVTVTPNAVTLNPILAFLDPDESERRTIDDGIINQPETFTFTQNASGYAAFMVRAGGVVVTDQAFTVTVKIELPPYTPTSGTTAYADVCATGTVHPAGGASGDEGFTAAIPTVTGFDFFGAAAAADFQVSTNGFLSFDPNALDPNYNPAPIPDEVGEASVAPLWNDIYAAKICSKVDGMKQTIQWTGEDYYTAEPIEMQVIFDASDDSIEFVYGPGHVVSGVDSTRGVQALGGLLGVGLGAFTDFVTPGSSMKLTPTP